MGLWKPCEWDDGNGAYCNELSYSCEYCGDDYCPTHMKEHSPGLDPEESRCEVDQFGNPETSMARSRRLGR